MLCSFAIFKCFRVYLFVFEKSHKRVVNHDIYLTKIKIFWFHFAGPVTDNYLVGEGQSVPGSAWSVSRADVAHFMLKSLQSKEWDKKGVAIAGKK